MEEVRCGGGGVVVVDLVVKATSTTTETEKRERKKKKKKRNEILSFFFFAFYYCAPRPRPLLMPEGEKGRGVGWKLRGSAIAPAPAVGAETWSCSSVIRFLLFVPLRPNHRV